MSDRGASVINGKVVRTSVSALQKMDSCERAWWYRYVARIPDKAPGKGAARGTAGHKRLARYLTTGEDILDPLERLGVTRGVLPTPGLGLCLDYSISGALAGDVPMAGEIDLIDVRDFSTGHSDTLHLIDFKFKKDIEAYGTRAEELIDPSKEAAIQMLGYANAVATRPEFEGVSQLRLAHYTWQTSKRPDISVTESTISLDSAKTLWQSVTSRVVPRLHEVAAAQEHEVKQTGMRTGQCDKYGGCPYKQRCHDPSQQLIAAFRKLETTNGKESSTNMGLDKFANKAPTTATVTSPAAPTGSDTLTARQAIQTKRYMLEGKPATFMVALSGRGGETRYSFRVDGDTKPTIVTGDVAISPLPDGEPVLARVLPPDAPVSHPVATTESPAPQTPQTESDMLSALTASIEHAKTTPAEKKARAKRTMKIVDAEPKPEPVNQPEEFDHMGPDDVSAADIAPVIVPEKPIVATKVEPEAPPVSSGIHLYFGCSPVGVMTKTLVGYVNSIDKTVRESAQLTGSDIRATNSSEYGFGKWKAYFSALATAKPPEPGHYVVTSGDERVEVVASALQEIAALVVRS